MFMKSTVHDLDVFHSLLRTAEGKALFRVLILHVFNSFPVHVLLFCSHLILIIPVSQTLHLYALNTAILKIATSSLEDLQL